MALYVHRPATHAGGSLLLFVDGNITDSNTIQQSGTLQGKMGAGNAKIPGKMGEKIAISWSDDEKRGKKAVKWKVYEEFGKEKISRDGRKEHRDIEQPPVFHGERKGWSSLALSVYVLV